MPHTQKTKTENKSNIVTNSIKTFKIVHKSNKKYIKEKKKVEDIV